MFHFHFELHAVLHLQSYEIWSVIALLPPLFAIISNVLKFTCFVSAETQIFGGKTELSVHLFKLIMNG